MGYKNFEQVIGEGTDDAIIDVITYETVTTEATEAVKKAKDEQSIYLGTTFREAAIERRGEMFRCWEAINFCAELAEDEDFNNDERRDFAWFLATSVTPAYTDALRRGEDGESAVRAAESLAAHISHSFVKYMIEQ